MKSYSLPTSSQEFEVQLGEREDAIILVPAQLRTRMAQAHYVLDLSTLKARRIEIDLAEHVELLAGHQDPDTGRFPLNLESLPMWQGFGIGPHSDTHLSQHKFQIGQRGFNRFIELDIATTMARLQDPEIEDYFLSCSNWVDPDTGDCYFAGWAIEDSIRRNRDPQAPVAVNVFRASNSMEDIVKIWSGAFGDFLHQLNVSADGRYLILCEMGMRPARPTPTGHPGNNPGAWRRFHQAGMIESEILVLDLERGAEWRFRPPTPTAAHIEFHPEAPDLCYLSCHNVALVNGANTLFAPGTIYKYHLGPDGPQQMGAFSSPNFYRITSHCVFRHRGRVLIGVTGFPDRLFLLDADSMDLYDEFRLFDGVQVDTSREPCFCPQDPRAPYGLMPSLDGESMYTVGSGVFNVVGIASKSTKCKPWSFFRLPSEEAIAGHLSSIRTN